jgi:hypothetical protein
MITQDQPFRRVREDVDAISTLVKQLNLPIESVLDKTSLNALCDSLKFEPELWDVEFLETILIIREGLYSLRDTLRDRNDEDAVFATEKLLGSLDRLHTDLYGALRSLNPPSINEAQAQIAALVHTPYIDVRSVRREVAELKADLNELLTRTHVTFQRFEVHLMRLNDAEVMRTAKLVVQRMSATAFAIKVSLEQNVIYQGIFRFLQEGADKIVDELKTITEHFKREYKDEKEFSDDLTRLVEKGSKLTRDIAKLLHQIFSDAPIEQKQLKLKTLNTLSGASMVCALRLQDNRVLLGGKDGWICVVNTQTGMVSDRHQMFEGKTINSLSRTGSSAVVAGTDQGLETINPTTMVSREFNSIYEENVAAVAVAPWGLVSGTRDGIARRWILDYENIVRYGAENMKLGRSIQRMTVVAGDVVVAAGQNLVFIDQHFKIDSQMPIDFQIRDMCQLDSKNLIICGDGAIAHVKLSGHKYTKYLAASEQAKYTCIAPMDANTFCVGNDDGVIAAIDLDSSAEIGVANVQFPLRGMLRTNNKLLAFGGAWQSKGRSIALLDWEEVIHRSKPLELDRT